MFSELADWVTTVIERLGYVGVAAIVALENVFPPIPSEIVLPFAGFVARDGDALFAGMIAAATMGSLLGAWVLYAASAAIGPDRLHAFLVRRGRWFRLRPADITRAEHWFDRHAVVAVLLGRCVPLVRSLVSVPAGFRRMRPLPFTLYTIVGSLIWNTGLISAGYLLRHNWEAVERWMAYAQYAVIAAIVVAAAVVFRRRVGSNAG